VRCCLFHPSSSRMQGAVRGPPALIVAVSVRADSSAPVPPPVYSSFRIKIQVRACIFERHLALCAMCSVMPPFNQNPLIPPAAAAICSQLWTWHQRLIMILCPCLSLSADGQGQADRPRRGERVGYAKGTHSLTTASIAPGSLAACLWFARRCSCRSRFYCSLHKVSSCSSFSG
jgi:hypothetical protein